MRTIDADAFDATMYEAWVNCEITNEEWFHFREMIKDEPTIEPQRMRGRWEDMGDFEQCSACTGTHLKEINTVYGKATWIKSAYCPNCGADMRGGQDD